ncbi:efflux RND transporter periplasmic adaptor subunit [Mesorhizobium denitrificans]|uniref:efflux RND transporter periplasmic adaptor subunit n=1 Tax=Mesorhizobium denitrificans TaxID=2294114 RepID=UPI0026966D53
MKRFLIAALLLLFVAVIVTGIVGYNFMRDKGIADFFANMPRPEITVSTQEVKETSWTPELEALGTVNANQGVNLTVETTGVVKDILFTANEKVQAGQVLLQLDDAVERADLEAGKATLANNRLVLQRALELQQRGVGSQSTLDDARAASSTSEAQVNRLQAILDQKQLTAPFAGTVGIPRIDDGQYLQPGTTVVTLQDLDRMRVDFTLPEQQLADLKIGQPIRLGPRNGDLSFTGKVAGIDPRVDPASRLVSVRGEVSNAQGKLTPGQFVQVRVQLNEQPNVIAVDQTAVVTSLYGDYAYVVRPADQAKQSEPAPAGQTGAASASETPKTDETKAEAPKLVANQVFVKTGRRSEGTIEIVSGLKAGDMVVTAGQNRLSNGAPVKVDNTVTLDAKGLAK